MTKIIDISEVVYKIYSTAKEDNIFEVLYEYCFPVSFLKIYVNGKNNIHI